MLLGLTTVIGSDWDSMLDSAVIASRFWVLRAVRYYAIIGAPRIVRPK